MIFLYWMFLLGMMKMRKCIECGHDDWELIIAYLKEEEEGWLDLYQCKHCKRVVCTTEEYLEMEGKI